MDLFLTRKVNGMKLLARKTKPYYPYLALSLGPADPRELTELYRTAFQVPDFEWVPDPNLVGLITAKSAGRIVGAASLIRPHFIHQFAIHPNFQRTGMGTQMLNYIVSTFDLSYVVVQTDETTQPSGHPFWKKMGFVELGT